VTEPLCWAARVARASIAVLNSSGRPRFARHVLNKGLVYGLGVKLLDGVGAGETFMKYGEVAFHVRRSLSDQEIAGLDPAWLAIPPVDMAG